jgi:hypothetical protein
MFITKKHLHRRTFLRGAGAAIALPLLDAMLPAFGQSRAGKSPLRFGVVYIPNGVYPGLWHPDTVGSGFAFKPIMKPLEPFRDALVTISQLQAPPGGPDNGGVHMGASAAFLNGMGPVNKLGSFGAIESKKSVDQYVADAIAEDTPLRSLEVGTEDMGTSAGACDGYPCTFFNTMAWRDDTSPLPVGINPQVTFERMFGEAGSPEQRLARLHLKRSLLDSVVAETSSLERTLGPADNALLDEYLTNIRRVEKQLQKSQSRVAGLEDVPAAPVGIPDTFDDHMTVTYDLMHLAFQGDISRVFSFMVGHEGSGRSYQFLGVPEPHHPTSHNGGTPEGIEKYAKICTYHTVKLAQFLEKLKGTQEGSGTLLDSAIVYFGAGMSDGQVHDRHNPPAALIGGADGRLKGNRHIAVKNSEPTSNLLLALANLYGADINAIGRSTGALSLS